MKKLLFVALIVASVGFYALQHRAIDDAQVAAFYRDMEVATLQRKPQALCDLLAPDFRSHGTVSVGGASRTDMQDKAQACEAYHGMFANFEKIGDQMGGMLQLDHSYTVHAVSIAADRQTATVDYSDSLDVAGSLMNIRSRSRDVLVRRFGKLVMLRSEGNGSIRTGS